MKSPESNKWSWPINKLIESEDITEEYAVRLRQMLDSTDRELFILAKTQIEELFFKTKK